MKRSAQITIYNERRINSIEFQFSNVSFNSFLLLFSFFLFSNCLGHLGAIRLLLLQNKLDMDAKNVFGFTPLMKAAIQGHIRCAKALLFAGNFQSIVFTNLVCEQNIF